MNNDNPDYRILRGYAFDPFLSTSFDTFKINIIEYKIPWEEITEGFKGEYIEIIDYDPSHNKTSFDPKKLNGTFYTYANLDSKKVLSENGISPDESNPHFHQQMVYAVSMTTINNFEKALGRKIIWQSGPNSEYVQRLRLYPHALREANAYYSPTKKAILFGYFKAKPLSPGSQMPNSLIFTCLSHDIITHEVTHAILDSLNEKYNYPTNPDVFAFHEAFADLIAIFQRFTFSKVLKDQISQTRGDLSKQNLLGQLAVQLGKGIGYHGSLRNFLGKEINGDWIPHKPEPDEYKKIMSPHERGAILVSALFEAFMNVYKSRSIDLIRIATNGTGELPEGEIHPDLVNILSKEASKTARHFLNICIRAVDYSPPVDITYGDYLKALITADCDLITDDPFGYRISIIEAFKRRGICYSPVNNQTKF